MSLSGVTPASLDVATVKIAPRLHYGRALRCGNEGRCLGSLGSIRSSQKIEPITAAPARTRAGTLNVRAPERRPAAKSIPFGSFEYELSDSGARGGSTSPTLVSLGLLEGASTKGCRDTVSTRADGAPARASRIRRAAPIQPAVPQRLRVGCRGRAAGARFHQDCFLPPVSSERLSDVDRVRARLMRAVGGERKADRIKRPTA